ncbi:hypothetical protein [Aquimarina algiphila]|uniref:hypothetical protein n=1 Tax=Aquimarina algiphila TaxID=2047982 RepID=UPI002330F603|nr:hypothetical protein [Aquimarina algiphila]
MNTKNSEEKNSKVVGLTAPENMNEVTPEHIAAWKREYGVSVLQQMEIEDSEYKAILKEPTREDIKFAGLASKKDPMKFNQVILERCWVFGDREIQDNTGLFLSACKEMDKILGIKKVTLKKL